MWVSLFEAVSCHQKKHTALSALSTGVEILVSTNNWDRKFMGLALHFASWSKDRSDRSKGVGAVIVGPYNEIRATGYNGFPRGVDDDVDARHERPEKYLWTEHAERNAIFNAARLGVAIHDCTLYVSMFPCIDCARAVIQTGIHTVVTVTPNLDDPVWGEPSRKTQLMFREAYLAASKPVMRYVSLLDLGLVASSR